jgi:hypothetical protein
LQIVMFPVDNIEHDGIVNVDAAGSDSHGIPFE